MDSQVRLVRFTDPVRFSVRVEPVLAQAEAANCLQLGIVAALRREAEARQRAEERARPSEEAAANGRQVGANQRIRQPPYLATLERNGEVQMVILRTPPFKLVLSTPFGDLARQGGDERGEGLEMLLNPLIMDVLRLYPDLPAVLGPTRLSRAAAEAWTRATGKPHHLDVALRIFELDWVTPPTGVPGAMRRATVRDGALVVEWVRAFQRDIGENDSPEDAERVAASRLAPDDNPEATGALGLYLWEDGGVPVSMAAAGSPTPNGARINLVYTPPEHRRHGYASACVATLSQRVLDSGRRFCFLFTDLANPTSNHIYQEIGYRPVVDVDDYVFGK
jgi:uncharacterized protein